MQQLLEIFPFIQQTKLDLEKQNKYLNKVTLTGKINALHVAANLFEFTEKTAAIFDELKQELIDALLEENVKKITNELEFKAKTVMEILIRNLYERTADVGFFSTDELIYRFLEEENVREEVMLSHLQEYAAKYSVYNEIVIFDRQGQVKIHLNKENNLARVTQDAIVQEALQSETYVEKYSHTDIFPNQKRTLMYAQKIRHNNKDLGVLCLCFKFEDELQTIFANLSHHKEKLAISDTHGILVSNGLKQNIAYSDAEYIVVQKRALAVTRKAPSYHGYSGVKGWYATALMNRSNFESPQEQEDETLLAKRSEPSKMLSQELNAVIEKANDIIEDIDDVIINGELIASKQRVYVLSPILDNLRDISGDLLLSIKKSIFNLEEVVKEGIIHDAKMASHLAIDIMDRNLYERANDCRWWALTPSFAMQLAQKEPDVAFLQEKLQYINDLYTVYTNIFLYDTQGCVVASSRDHALEGTSLQNRYVSMTLSNTNTQRYFVSAFEKTPLYDGKATYIYSASIVQNGQVLGGIGVVFDAEVEFRAILQESFPAAKEGFMVFVDAQKRVIASSSDSIAILSTLGVDDKFVACSDSHSVYDFVEYEGASYLVSSTTSQGYREYKKEDNYTNSVYCLCFIKQA